MPTNPTDRDDRLRELARVMGTGWYLRDRGGELNGYRFTDEKHATDWIEQPGVRNEEGKAQPYVVELKERSWSCDCPNCEMSHVKPYGSVLSRIDVEATPQRRTQTW